MRQVIFFVFLAGWAFSLLAQEAAPSGEPVRAAEIHAIADNVKMEEWGKLAAKSNFTHWGAPKRYERSGGDRIAGGYTSSNASADPVERAWDSVGYPSPEGRRPMKMVYKEIWIPACEQANALLKRPCTTGQKRWLENFLEAAAMIEKRDAEKLQKLVLQLTDDLRGLF